MPNYPMKWHPTVIQTVPPEMLAELTRYIDHGDIHRTDWIVRQVLQFNFVKIGRQADDADLSHLGFLLSAIVCQAPQGCFGSEQATLDWPGLRALQASQEDHDLEP